MTSKPAKELEFTTTVAAPIEAAWDAITTAQGLSAWYVSSAEISPELGGELSISFGEGPPGVSKIDVWEPPSRVRFAYVPQGGMEVGDTEGGSEEWLLTHEDGVTTVRLVHSLPDPGVEDWEGYYGDITRGWRLFLATLRFYVERTERRGRVTSLAVPKVTDKSEAVWQRLQDELGLGSVTPGSTTSVSIGDDTVPAVVLEAAPPLGILLDVDGTLLFADIEGGGDHRMLYTLASTFTTDTPEQKARRSALVAAAERAASG
ncbi:MAG: SRPBCC domain-containing protein [Acidimicrobiia bacterium]|nr:SRPBCC domain-containing protein [Acidimicrobiia bacterium]